MKPWLAALGLILLILFPLAQVTGAEEELLDPAQAFVLTAKARDADTVVAEWTIADSYYMYREQFKFESTTPGIRLGEPNFPSGKITEDEFFGRQEIYRQKVAIEIPVQREEGAPNQLELKTVSQGCADLGVCYPPQTQTVTVDLPPLAAAPPTALPASEEEPSQPEEEELLDPEEAFAEI